MRYSLSLAQINDYGRRRTSRQRHGMPPAPTSPNGAALYNGRRDPAWLVTRQQSACPPADQTPQRGWAKFRAATVIAKSP